MRERITVAIVLTCLGLGTLAPCGGAAAQAPSELEQAYARASEHEHHGEPRAALAAWREVVRLGPGTRMSARAARRIGWLLERGEGDFAPLEALLSFQSRRDRTLADADAFEERIRRMPLGRVRVESRLSLAQAFGTLGATDRATATYRAVLDEPELRPDEARLARDELAGVLAEGGDVDAALSELESSGLETSARHGVLLRSSRRRFLEPLAWAFVGLYVVAILGGIYAVRGRRRAQAALSDPWALATCMLVASGPYLIARAAGDEATSAFAMLGLANAVGLALAFGGGAAFRGAPQHAIRAVSITAALAALGTGYLAALYQAQSLPFA